MAQDPPIYEDVIEGTPGKLKLAWILFLSTLNVGDPGTEFTPIVHNLTVVGADPVITGEYYENAGFTDFWIKIVPGTSTSAVAGTTYFDLPFDVTVDGSCEAVSGNLGENAGMVEAATNRCYPPAWTTVTAPLTISGRVRTA